MTLLNHNIMASEGYTDEQYCADLGIDKKHCNKETINIEIANAIAAKNFPAEYDSAIEHGKNHEEATAWADLITKQGLADAKKHIKQVEIDRKKNNLTYPVET